MLLYVIIILLKIVQKDPEILKYSILLNVF